MQVQSTVCGAAERGEWKQDGNLSSGCAKRDEHCKCSALQEEATCYSASHPENRKEKEIERDQLATRLDSDQDSKLNLP